jgi:hypothetical protein
MGASLRDVRFDWLVLWGLAGGYFLLACVSKRIQFKVYHNAETEN